MTQDDILLQENTLWLICHILCDEAEAKTFVLKEFKILPIIKNYFTVEEYEKYEFFIHIASWILQIITSDLPNLWDYTHELLDLQYCVTRIF